MTTEKVPTKPVRVNVNLLPYTADCLAQLEETTDLTKTQLINQAIVVYSMLLEYQSKGVAILTREGDGEPLHHHFF